MAVPVHMMTKNFVAPIAPVALAPPDPVAELVAVDADPAVLVDGMAVRLAMVPLAKVKPPTDDLGAYLNPRRSAPMPISELADSLRDAGQKEPIRVFERDGFYYLLDGDRRVQAARKLGWTEIVAIVFAGEFSVDRIRQYMLLADVRQHLPPSAVAASIVALVQGDPVRWTETKLAAFLGKPASAIPVYIALAQAPETVRKAVDTFEATGGASGMSITGFRQLMNRPRAQQAEVTEKALAAAEKKGKAVTVDQVKRAKAEVIGESGASSGFGLLEAALGNLSPAFTHLNEAAAYISANGPKLSTAERAQLGTAARSILAALDALKAS